MILPVVGDVVKTKLDISGNISVFKHKQGHWVPQGCSGFMVTSDEYQVDALGFRSLYSKLFNIITQHSI